MQLDLKHSGHRQVPMNRLSRLRFDALAGYVRSPYGTLIATELDWFEAGHETVLGVVSIDNADLDYAAAVLGRDLRGRYRAVDVKTSLPSREDAKGRLHTMLDDALAQPPDWFHQGDESGQRVDFFSPVVAPEKLSGVFRRVIEDRGYASARGVLEAMTYYFEDPDGNFVEQFQTTGFDARVWELYLYAALTELGFAFTRTFAAPDFFCTGLAGEVLVEATTVNPSAEPPTIDASNEAQYFSDYVPMKFGSALFSKLSKRYWELAHVQGRPLVLAVQDFHAPGSMTWSNSALREALYGVRQTADPQRPGSTRSERVSGYTWDGKAKPSAFFEQPNAEYISAVLANPEGTISKFNRMGWLSGFGPRDIRMFRSGVAYTGGVDPVRFSLSVSQPGYAEAWSEGIEVFHNPNALVPMSPGLMPQVAHSTLRDGTILSWHPPFFPVGSQTHILVPEGSSK